MTTALNTLSYTGIVTLSLYNRKTNTKNIITQVHNAGSRNLFNFFTDCLVGDFDIAKKERPTKIMLLYIDDATQPATITKASSFIYLLTPPEKVYNLEGLKGETVRFSFVIPRALVDNATFNAIGLYADNTQEEEYENFAAYCNIKLGANAIAWDASSVLAVDWALNIANAPEANSTEGKENS